MNRADEVFGKYTLHHPHRGVHRGQPGDWIYHCHVTDHMMGGMVGRYKVIR
ncbi:multicopper oxidase domain-containing protein [Kitasatospora aureofaciens]|uniref:multicopper oxidase domain-containing protein n=1 Tax=Kitasatospora aureofaciens TaxID=1894 RepID=UPI0033C012BD